MLINAFTTEEVINMLKCAVEGSLKPGEVDFLRVEPGCRAEFMILFDLCREHYAQGIQIDQMERRIEELEAGGK